MTQTDNAVRSSAEPAVADRNRRLGTILAIVALSSLALSPVLYWSGSALCDYFGLGFNPDNPDRDAIKPADTAGPVTGRMVDVRLTAHTDPELRGLVRFGADDPKQSVEVGRYQRTAYSITNISERTLYIRPIHTVSPPQAAQQFMMVECFCYNDMELQPGESRDLGVVYGFKPEMDVRIRRADVRYSVHPISRNEMREEQDMPDEGPFQPLDAQERDL